MKTDFSLITDFGYCSFHTENFINQKEEKNNNENEKIEIIPFPKLSLLINHNFIPNVINKTLGIF